MSAVLFLVSSYIILFFLSLCPKKLPDVNAVAIKIKTQMHKKKCEERYFIPPLFHEGDTLGKLKNP